MSISNLIEDARYRLGVLRESERRFSEQLAPRFGLFDAFRFDELALSRCLAALLDPAGTHGQGALYLESFLQLLTSVGVNFKPVLLDCREAKVALESSIENQRRIDILIDVGDLLIGIENKPWAADQAEQLADYGQWLKGKNRPGWALVYLSNCDVSETSLCGPKREQWIHEGHLIEVNYSQLEDWLGSVMLQTRAPVVRCYIEHLMRRIRLDINGELEMSEAKEIQDLIFNAKGEENLKSVLAIAKAWPDVQESLIDRLIGQLKKQWEPIGNVEIDQSKRGGGRYLGFMLKAKQEANFAVCFQFQAGSYRALFGGLAYTQAAPSERAGAREMAAAWEETLKKAYGGGSGSDYWAWGVYAGEGFLDAEYFNWSDHAAPWLAINAGTLAGRLVAQAKEWYAKVGVDLGADDSKETSG